MLRYDDKFYDFMREEVVEDIRSVPGIGPHEAESMAEAGVTSTYQLIAKFLSYRGKGVTAQETGDKFWDWLGEHKVLYTRSHVTEAIAEKACLCMPGICNSVYDGEVWARQQTQPTSPNMNETINIVRLVELGG